MVPPGLDQLTAQLDRATAEATGALDELRGISRGLHPAVLAEGGLRSAFAMLARRSPVPVELDVRVSHRLPEQVEVSTFYMVAEAFTNAVKHAHASAVSVVVDLDSGAAVLHFTVRDNGSGGASLARGTGLIGLKRPRRGPGRQALPRLPARHRNRPAGGAAAGPRDEPVAAPEPVPRDRRRHSRAPTRGTAPPPPPRNDPRGVVPGGYPPSLWRAAGFGSTWRSPRLLLSAGTDDGSSDDQPKPVRT